MFGSVAKCAGIRRDLFQTTARPSLGDQTLAFLKAPLITILLLIAASPSHALDARHPDPLSVVAAAFAAQNVGNVDAATAFYADDAQITNTRGKALPSGKEGVRHFHEANRAANVQFSLGANPTIEGNKITTLTTTTIEFFEKVGLSSVEIGVVIIVDGDRIKSFLPYYPLRAVARIDEACRERGANVPFFGRPCSEFVDGAKAYTNRLIADGMVKSE
jgi:hypothetical protein